MVSLAEPLALILANVTDKCARATFLVRPPRPLDLLPVESGGAEREPPNEDTVLSGAIEVTMKERKRSKPSRLACRAYAGCIWGRKEVGKMMAFLKEV